MKTTVLFLLILFTTCSVYGLDGRDTIDADEFSQITFEKTLFFKVNEYRQSKGLKPLMFNQLIRKAANDHAIYLVNTGKLTHEQDVLKSKTVQDRVRKYVKSGRFIVAENIARTYVLRNTIIYDSQGKKQEGTVYTYGEAAEAMFNAWKQSNFHNKNMLSDKYSIAAIAVEFKKEDLSLTSVQVFAHFG